MDAWTAPISVAWREPVIITIALPSLASFLASSGGVIRGSLSFRAISFQRSSLARFSGVEMTAIRIGRFCVDSPIVMSFILLVSVASFWK